MNKIKLLMLLIMAATGMTVSAADAGYEFVESDGGKTLTIKGYGDLTTCSQTSTKKVFAAAANGNIYTNNSGTSVTPLAAYNSSAKYYYATREYTQVFNGGAPSGYTYVWGVETTTAWSEAAKSLHIYDIYYNGTNFGREGEINNLSNTNSGYINNSLSLATGKSEPVNWAHYYVYSTSEIPWGTDLIPGTNCYFVNSDIVNASTTYKAGSNLYPYLYRSQDGGKTMELLVKDQQYTYNPGDLFYIPDGNVTFTQIAKNDDFFAEHPAYLEDAEVTFKEALLAQLSSGSYTKVVFENTGTKGEMLIDPQIAQEILYNGTASRTDITTVDLGEATLKLTGEQTFKDILINPNASSNVPTVENLTIPMMPKVDDEMTLPASALVDGIKNTSPLKTLTVPEGYTKIGNSALSNASVITTVNLPKGLKVIGDNAFSNCAALTNLNITGEPVEGRSIVLPSSLEDIGKEAFASTAIASTKDDPFILPSGLKKVKASAFVNLTNLKFLELNEGLEYVGNTAFGLDHEVHDQTTITFPSTIKYLGPGSFISRWYQDIYFTGDTAPVCPVGKPAFDNWGNVTAFSANTQMGNNGFNPYLTKGSTADNAHQEGYANRENYVNNGYYFSILHFPDGLSDDQAKTYRDITRRYVTAKGNEQDTSGEKFYYSGSIANFTDPVTGETFGSAFQEGTRVTSEGIKSNLVYYMSSDGNGLLEESANAANLQPGYIDTYLGAQQIWPSQMQWTRSFVTVANGVEWDGVKKYRPTVTEEMFNMMKEDGLYVKANSLDYSTKRVADANNGNGYGKVFDISTMTWGELNNDEKDYLSLILYQGTRRFVLGNDSPYDIPFKMEMEAGRWWSICLPFNMTKKQIDEVFGEGTHVCLFSGVKRTDGDDKLLRLEFINDVYHHKTERTVKNNGSSIEYTYGANYSTSNPEPADDDIVIYARESYMIYPTKKSGDAAGVAVRNFGTPDFTIGDPLPTMIQANSDTPYIIDGSHEAYRFIGNFNSTASYGSDGKPVTVKIPKYSYGYGTLNGETKFFILNTDKATWSPFKSIVQNLARDGGEDDWNNFFQKSSTGAKQVSIFGLDEYLTGVENVIIEASSDNGADKAVYNINGSYVGDSLQGLAPGVYVKQGKAYIVK